MASIQERIAAARQQREVNVQTNEQQRHRKRVEEQRGSDELREKNALFQEQRNQLIKRFYEQFQQTNIYKRTIQLESETLQVCEALLDDIEKRYGNVPESNSLGILSLFRASSKSKRPELIPKNYLPYYYEWMRKTTLNLEDIPRIFESTASINAHFVDFLRVSTAPKLPHGLFASLPSLMVSGLPVFSVELPIDTIRMLPAYSTSVGPDYSFKTKRASYIFSLKSAEGRFSKPFEELVAPLYESFIENGLEVIGRKVVSGSDGSEYGITAYVDESHNEHYNISG